jgi:tetratricopeptide (TPR) repeat protein
MEIGVRIGAMRVLLLLICAFLLSFTSPGANNALADVRDPYGCVAFCGDIELMTEMDMDEKLAQAVHYNNIGVELSKEDKLDEAIEEYRKALEHVPDYRYALENLAAALNLKGVQIIKEKRDYIKAVSFFEEAHKLRPKRREIERNLIFAIKKAAKQKKELQMKYAFEEAQKAGEKCSFCSDHFIDDVNHYIAVSQESLRDDVIHSMNDFNECLVEQEATGCLKYCGNQLFNDILDSCEAVQDQDQFRGCIKKAAMKASGFSDGCL